MKKRLASEPSETISARSKRYRRRQRLFYRPPQSAPELKADDTTVSANFNTTGEVTLINGIARGDALNERIDRKIFLKSVYIHGYVFPTDTTGVAQAVRYLIVYDKQTNAATPAVTDILTSATPYAHLNLSNALRFKVLADETIGLSDATGTSTDYKPIKCYRKINLPQHFNNGDAGTVADITTGALFLVCVGSEAAGVTDAEGAMGCRVRYIDN